MAGNDDAHQRRDPAHVAACGSPAEVAAHVRDRVDGVGDRVCLYQTGPIATDALAQIVDELASRP